MNNRFQMNRIGFVNFWLYDEEIFEFAEGKLLLRGQNGSGKSITTQSFIPFILDGDRTPSRLDPFGSSDRRMEYYFLGEDGQKEESTGYLFLEFYKEETNEYRTIGIGQRARRGKPMEFWGFVLLDGRRIGSDLFLYKEAGSNRIPYAKNELKKLLGETVPFTDVPKEYKELVNRHIFGFRKLEHYEQFIKLLVKVRAPKLSKEFKPTKVYEILNESLQTLTDEDLRAMVDAMEKMDGIQESLEGLKRAFLEVKIIRNEYIRYNQYMLGKKAQAYLEQKKAVEEAEKKVRDNEAEKLQLQEEQRERQETERTAGHRVEVINVELSGLYDADLEGLDQKLETARKNFEAAEQQLKSVEDRIQGYQERIRQQESALRRTEENLEMERDQLQEAQEELNDNQEIISWDGHMDALSMIRSERSEHTQEVETQLRELRKELDAARAALLQYEEAQKEYDRAAQAQEQAAQNKIRKEEEEGQLQQQLLETEEDLAAALYAQAASNQEWILSTAALQEAERLIKQYERAADGESVRTVFRQEYEAKRDLLHTECLHVNHGIQELEKQMQQTQIAYEQVQNQPEVEPERSPQTIRSRAAMELHGIKGVPFFKTVEFAEGLDEAACASLEAQLEQMGILDALVVAEEDFARIREELPEFLDTVLYAEQEGATVFPGLVVSAEQDEKIQSAVQRILRNLEMEFTGIACIRPDGTFRQGILTGKADKEGEAEYVGLLARRRKKEQLLARLQRQMEELEGQLAQLREQELHLHSRLDTLQEEYNGAPDCTILNELLAQLQKCALELSYATEQLQKCEQQTAACEERRQQKYQVMLRSCKKFPYERTVAEYTEVCDAAEEYGRIWSDIRFRLVRIEGERSKIAGLRDQIDQLEGQIDDSFLDKDRCKNECQKQQVLIRQYEDYRNRPEIRELTARIASLKEEKRKLEKDIVESQKRLAVIEKLLEQILQGEDAQKHHLQELIVTETALKLYFEEELDLKLVVQRENKPLIACAKEAMNALRDGDRNREATSMQESLTNVFRRNSSSLLTYGTELESCFQSEALEDHTVNTVQGLRSRVLLTSVWNGKKVYLEEFYTILKTTIDETEQLIQDKDRELFEDILSRTISRQLTDRIAESRKWVQDMSALMKQMDTSMGLRFSLDWKPKAAENQEELGTQELEQILLRDRALLTEEDILRVAAHFRSRIRAEKQRQEERGDLVNYMDLVRDALDYRKWFEFQMYYRRGEEQKKPLTNGAFNKFSGGEKAMAMYVPLFAAVNAQYQKAEHEDHPRIIALDEAFAGVDDKNISSMFELVQRLDFDFIMNSQVLWGCFANVSALRIAELQRPANSQVVTAIRFTWNGHERILDEQ